MSKRSGGAKVYQKYRRRALKGAIQRDWRTKEQQESGGGSKYAQKTKNLRRRPSAAK